MKPTRIETTSAKGHKLNLEALYRIAPSCFTEVLDVRDKDHEGGTLAVEKEGRQVRMAVNFKTLRRLLGDDTVEDSEELYQFTWPGKQAARREAATPVTDTLRPVPEDSLDWDTTENLYIEGDNLRVLKLLQRGYMGKVKMIYIDPPYNTGNDFVYNDDFTADRQEYAIESGAQDELGYRYRKNSDSNGRFHSDWCSMIYPRLMVARTLLAEDGVIFISIDDNEVHNLRKICDEVFGAANFRNTIITRRRTKSLNAQFAEDGLYSLNVGFEYILVYSKSTDLLLKAIRSKKNDVPSKGRWDVFWSNADRPTMRYNILGFTPTSGQWRNSKEKAEKAIQNYQTYITDYSQKMTIEEYSTKTGIIDFIRRIPNGKGKNGGVQHWIAPSDTILRTSNWLDIEVSQINKEIDLPFDNPKNRLLIQELIKLSEFSSTDIILDFFSGSATTAHAVMQLNAEDGGKRKYICVQLAEETPEDSEARKAGYATIPEIAKERIRRAGKKIKDESPLNRQNLDTGFRVFRLADSNYEDVTKQPGAYDQKTLDLFADNIKADRTDLDLLFGAMLSWGVQLSMPMTTEEVDDCKIYTVDGNGLVACFAEHITENVVKAMAAKQPLRVLFRDSCFSEDKTKINIFELFKQQLDWDENEALDNIRVI